MGKKLSRTAAELFIGESRPASRPPETLERDIMAEGEHRALRALFEGKKAPPLSAPTSKAIH